MSEYLRHRSHPYNVIQASDEVWECEGCEWTYQEPDHPVHTKTPWGSLVTDDDVLRWKSRKGEAAAPRDKLREARQNGLFGPDAVKAASGPALDFSASEPDLAAAARRLRSALFTRSVLDAEQPKPVKSHNFLIQAQAAETMWRNNTMPHPIVITVGPQADAPDASKYLASIPLDPSTGLAGVFGRGVTSEAAVETAMAVLKRLKEPVTETHESSPVADAVGYSAVESRDIKALPDDTKPKPEPKPKAWSPFDQLVRTWEGT